MCIQVEEFFGVESNRGHWGQGAGGRGWRTIGGEMRVFMYPPSLFPSFVSPHHNHLPLSPWPPSLSDFCWVISVHFSDNARSSSVSGNKTTQGDDRPKENLVSLHPVCLHAGTYLPSLGRLGCLLQDELVEDDLQTYLPLGEGLLHLLLYGKLFRVRCAGPETQV